MTYGRIPLFPPGNQCGNTWVEDFRRDRSRRGYDCSTQTVRLCNPCRPWEYADVELSVDLDGNLSVCVRRPPAPCAPCRTSFR